MGDLVHRVHGLVDLIDTGGLLRRRRRDLGDDVADLLDPGHDIAERPAGLIDQLGPDLDLLDGILDQALDLLRGGRGTPGKVAHLGRDHREPAALLTGPGGLDRGIQGQQIGLERDLVDHGDDLGDLATGGIDLSHRIDRATDDIPALLGELTGAVRQLIGLLRIVGVVAYRRGQLFHRRRGLFQRRGLLLGAGRQVVVPGRDLRRAVVDRVGRVAQFTDGLLDVAQGRIHIVLDLAEGAGVLALDRPGHVTGGHRLHRVGDVRKRAVDHGDQRVDALAELPEEALFARQVDPSPEVAGARRRNHLVDLPLDRDLLGPVGPLDHRAEALAVRIGDRIGDHLHGQAGDLDLAADRVPDRIEHAALVARIPVEHVHVPPQQTIRREPGQRPAQIRLGGLEHPRQRPVHVDDPVVLVGYHHRTADIVERRSDAQILGRLAALLGEPIGRFALGLQRRGQVGPLDRGTEVFAVRVHDRVGDDTEGAATDLDGRLMGVVQALEQPPRLPLVGRELVEAAADQAFGLETGYAFAQVLLDVPEQVPAGLVQIDDVPAPVRHHYMRTDAVERGLDPGRRVALAPGGFDQLTELPDGLVEIAGQHSDLVVRPDTDPARPVRMALGHVTHHAAELSERSGHDAGKQQAENDQPDHHQRGIDGGVGKEPPVDGRIQRLQRVVDAHRTEDVALGRDMAGDAVGTAEVGAGRQRLQDGQHPPVVTVAQHADRLTGQRPPVERVDRPGMFATGSVAPGHRVCPDNPGVDHLGPGQQLGARDLAVRHAAGQHQGIDVVEVRVGQIDGLSLDQPFDHGALAVGQVADGADQHDREQENQRAVDLAAHRGAPDQGSKLKTHKTSPTA